LANQMSQRLSTRRLANMTVNMACNSFEGYNKKKGEREERRNE